MLATADPFLARALIAEIDLPIAVVELDARRTITHLAANPAYCRALGCEM
jgi:hypothetical protein